MNRRGFLYGTITSLIATQLWPKLSFSMPNAKDYEKKALEFCESRFQSGAGTCCYFSVTGEPYVVLQTGGVEAHPFQKIEGHRFDDFYGGDTPDKALAELKVAFGGYTNGMSKHNILYWRHKPTLTCQITHFGGNEISEWYRFYVRLLVTDTSPVEYFKRAREGTLAT